MRLRLWTAILIGKGAYHLSRIGGGRGSSLPGLVALRLYPEMLGAFARQARCGAVMVTGTNGKTTTNNMLARVLEAEGARVVANREGANLVTGVTTAFIRASSIGGRVGYDWAVLEVDEAAFPRVAEVVRPRLVVVTNFFRDQLDRYGELDKTVSFIRSTVAKLPATKLVLNADDPLVTMLADTGREVLFFGLGAPTRGEEAQGTTREARFCPYCGQEFTYDYYHYSQLGAYRCSGCGFARPRAQVEALSVQTLNGVTRSVVRVRDEVLTLTLPTPGFYNVYNALAVFGVGLWLGIAPEKVAASLHRYVPATGRLQEFVYKGRPVYLNLVKNPAGFNESLNLLTASPEPKDVFIALNDNDADGRDISWIWDVDFERLENRKEILRFVCAGRRAEEMALRLKYAGIAVQKIETCSHFAAGVRRALEGYGSIVYLLATYTALWPVEKILRRLATEVNGANSLPSVPRSS
ncbi:MurT ligase domain-containing protein [Thermodesulfitimonas sp.]